MKVKTHLKSGSIVDDASQEVTKAVNQISEFVSEAGLEAEKITGGLTNAANCVISSF